MIKIEKMIFVVLINLYLILYLNYKNKIMCKQPFDFQRYIILSKPQFRPTFVSFVTHLLGKTTSCSLVYDYSILDQYCLALQITRCY